jgi:hypothetical protein
LDVVEGSNASYNGERARVSSEVSEELGDREEDCSVVLFDCLVFFDAKYALSCC